MTQTRTPRPKPTNEAPARKIPVIPIIGGIAVIALIITVVFTVGDGAGEYGTVTVQGQTLGRYGGSPASDQALGVPSPGITGESFDGSTLTIDPADGRPKMLLFVAHWCPVCQAEVPVVSQWLADGGLPDGVDIVAIATGTSTTRENYPPSEWLDRENLDVPTIVDSEDYAAANAFGLSAYPFWAFVNPDGTIYARFSGGISPTDLSAIAGDLLG